MKVFQIVSGVCYYEGTKLYSSAEEASKFYTPDIVWVDAPNYVFEGWGYDDTQEGDARFIQPTAPEGWIYDPETGTFYPEGTTPPEEIPSEEEDVNAMLVDLSLRVALLELGGDI